MWRHYCCTPLSRLASSHLRPPSNNVHQMPHTGRISSNRLIFIYTRDRTAAVHKRSRSTSSPSAGGCNAYRYRRRTEPRSLQNLAPPFTQCFELPSSLPQQRQQQTNNDAATAAAAAKIPKRTDYRASATHTPTRQARRESYDTGLDIHNVGRRDQTATSKSNRAVFSHLKNPKTNRTEQKQTKLDLT